MVGNVTQIIRFLAGIKDQDRLYEIKEYKQRRSLTANAYFHVLCTKIGEAITPRLSRNEVHNWMIADYGQLDEDVRTIILRDDIDWRKLDTMHLRPTTATRTLDDGKLYRVYHLMRGSHTYNTKEMTKLIDGVVQEAQALNIETVTVSERDKMIESWGKQCKKRHGEPEGQMSLFMGGG